MSYRPLADKRHKLARQMALNRFELGTDGGKHQTVRPVGLVSAPIKLMDAETRRLIDEAVAARAKGCGA
jgi:hypothetical protein